MVTASNPDRTRMDQWQRWSNGVKWSGLVLLVWGARLGLIQTAGNSLPSADQVTEAGATVILPWAQGAAVWSHLFTPTSGPAAVFERLLAWGVVATNNQWDNYVSLLISAGCAALLLPMLLHTLPRALPSVGRWLFAGLITAVCVLPVAATDALNAASLSSTLALGFGLVQLQVLLDRQPRGAAVRAGALLAGLLALGCPGIGVSASGAVAVALAVRAVRERVLPRGDATALGLSLVWIVLGLPGLHSPGDGLASFVALAGDFPLTGYVLLALLFAPTLALLVTAVRAREGETDTRALGLAVWALIWLSQSPASGSTLAVGLLVAAWGWTRIELPPRVHRRALGIWVALVACIVCLPLADAAKVAMTNQTREPAVPPDASFWSQPQMRPLLPAIARPPIAFPAVSAEERSNLPPTSEAVIAVSPATTQREPWRWHSERQPASTLPILRFRFSGGLGDPAAALRLRVSSDAGATEVMPDGAARQRWRTINVIRPPGDWWIELIDSDSLDQVALTTPVELGWLSWATEKLLKYHAWFLCSGVALLLAGALAQASARRFTPAAAESRPH